MGSWKLHFLFYWRPGCLFHWRKEKLQWVTGTRGRHSPKYLVRTNFFYCFISPDYFIQEKCTSSVKIIHIFLVGNRFHRGRCLNRWGLGSIWGHFDFDLKCFLWNFLRLRSVRIEKGLRNGRSSWVGVGLDETVRVEGNKEKDCRVRCFLLLGFRWCLLIGKKWVELLVP